MTKLFDPYAEFESATLANGMRVYALQRLIPWSYVGVVAHVGAKDDSAGKEGLAHMTEHMVAMNKSPSKSMKVSDNPEAALGVDEITFYTDRWCTSRLVRLMPEADLLVCIKCIARSWFEPLAAEHFDSERAVVEQEYYHSHPSWLLEQINQEPYLLFDSGSRLARSQITLGEPKTIESFTFEDTAAHHKKWYTPSNTSLVFIGRQSLKELLNILEETAFSATKTHPRNTPRISHRLPMPLPIERRYRPLTLSEFNIATTFPEDQAAYWNSARLPALSTFMMELITIRIQNEATKSIRTDRSAAYDIETYYHGLIPSGGSIISIRIPMMKKSLLNDMQHLVDIAIKNARKDRPEFEQLKQRRIAELKCQDLDLRSIMKQAIKSTSHSDRINTIAEEIAIAHATTFEQYRDVFKWLRPEYRLTQTLTR